jgi:hypothetical protein
LAADGPAVKRIMSNFVRESARSNRRRLALESLEPRAVPALLAQLNAGVLGIWGTDDGDEIVVRQIAGRLSVDGAGILINGVERPSVSILNVKRIDIACGEGNDTVYLNSQMVAGQQAIVKPTYIWGEGGDDWVEGGQGNDSVDAGTGEDVVFGHGGNDVLYAEGAKLFLYGGDGNDRIEAEGTEMVLDGGAGLDRIRAFGDGSSWIDGGIGNDTLTGGEGPDVMTGGVGNDSLLGNGGADDLDGGAGLDILWGSWMPKQETLEDGVDVFRDQFNPAQYIYLGATVSDIMQMGSPLCTTLAGMSAAIWSGFRFADSLDYAGDTTYGVALFNPSSGQWEGHAVEFDGAWTDLDANVPRNAYGVVLPEFWPVLIARATLQQRGVDLANTNIAYIESNYPTDASDILTRLTSWDTADVAVTNTTPAALRAAFYGAGHAFVASTYDDVMTTPGVVANHAYSVIDIVNIGGIWYVYLFNPWGRDFDTTTRPKPFGVDDGLIVLRWDQFVADFESIARTV